MALSHAMLHSLLPGLALGALDASDERRLRSHLAKGCPACQAEWQRLQAAAAKILDTASFEDTAIQAPASIKAKLMSLIREPPLKVSFLKGIAYCQGQPLRGPANIHSNDALECVSGELELQAAGQSTLKLLPGSLARLARKAGGLELMIERGAALIHVVSGQPFLTRLPLGEIRVRGTYFFAEARGPNESYVCLCEGWVDLSAPGFHQEMKSDDHSALILKSRQGKISAKAVAEDHPELVLGKP